MGKQHLNDLKHRRQGMSSDAISTAQTSWQLTADSLVLIHEALDGAAEAMPTTNIGGEAILEQARTAFQEAAKRVGERQSQISGVATALAAAYPAMTAAEKAADGAPTVTPLDPGPAPGTGATTEELNDWAAKNETYKTDTKTVNDADEDARQKVETLLKEYATTVTALKEIKGEPKVPVGDGGGDPGPVGPRYQPPPRSTPVGTWIGTGKPDHPDVHVPHDPGHTGGPHDPGHTGGPHDPGYPGYPGGPHDPGYPGHPGGPGGHGGPGGSGGDHGVGPAVLGGAAAGVFGAPGLVRGIRGLVAGRGLSGSSVGAIGSSSRTGGPGSLGRTGSGTPGSPVSRGGGRGGAAGRGGAGGRGSGAAGAAGGRGRRRDGEKEGRDRDLFDDGEEWIDDEGAAPGVLD